MAEAAGVQRAIEAEILAILKEAKAEVHTEQLAEQLGITRHTAAKYLEILRAKGQVRCRKVGNAKLWRAFYDIVIRPLTLQDLPTLLCLESSIEEDRGLAGQKRLLYLEEMARQRIAQGQPCLGAFLNVRLVGFALGEIRLWEFASGEKTGWIEVLGVDPEFWGLGIGRRLGEALMAEFTKRGVTRVRTLVDWFEGDLLSYFKALGFEVLHVIPLGKNLEPSPLSKEYPCLRKST